MLDLGMKLMRKKGNIPSYITSLQAKRHGDWRTLRGPESVTSLTGIQYDEDGNPVAHNYIPNSEGVGGAAGVLPTGWSKFDGDGITTTVAGAGDGYTDFRYTGTATALTYPGVYLCPATISGLTGQVFTFSADVSVVSNAQNAPTKTIFKILEYTSASGYLTNGFSEANVGTTGVYTRVLSSATCGLIRTSIVLPIPNGTTVDFTIRISRPQLSKSAVKLTYTPTYGSAVFMPYVSPTKGLRASGAWTNALPAGAENISLWGKVGTFTTGFLGPNGEPAYKFEPLVQATPSVSGNGRFVNSTTGANGAYNNSIWARSVSGTTPLDIYVCNRATATIVGSTSRTIGESWQRIDAAGITAGAATGAEMSVSSQYPIIVCLPQITSGPYLFDYIPPGITNSASSSTTGGGGTNTLLNNDMLECLRGKVDGVELAGSDLIAWSESYGPYVTHTANSFTTTQTGGVIYGPFTVGDRIWIYVSGESGAEFSVRSADALSPTASTLLYTGFGSFEWTVATGRLYLYFRNGIAGTSLNISFSIQRLLPSVFTAVAVVHVGVGSGELNGSARNILSTNNLEASPLFFMGDNVSNNFSVIVSAFDGTSYPGLPNAPWNRNEIHVKPVQTNAAGTQFRVGNRRYTSAMVPIDALTWGSWAAYDGSLGPLTHLRLALNGTIPLGFLMTSLSSKSLSDAEILKQLRYVK